MPNQQRRTLSDDENTREQITQTPKQSDKRLEKDKKTWDSNGINSKKPPYSQSVMKAIRIRGLSLPFLEECAQSLVSEESMLPQEIWALLPQIPDHIQEARVECVRLFITQVLAPRMMIRDPLSVDELMQLAQAYKMSFAQQHPKDFVGDFEIVPAIELELMRLYLVLKDRSAGNSWVGLQPLLMRAAHEIKDLLDEAPEILYAI